MATSSIRPHLFVWLVAVTFVGTMAGCDTEQADNVSLVADTAATSDVPAPATRPAESFAQEIESARAEVADLMGRGKFEEAQEVYKTLVNALPETSEEQRRVALEGLSVAQAMLTALKTPSPTPASQPAPEPTAPQRSRFEIFAEDVPQRDRFHAFVIEFVKHINSPRGPVTDEKWDLRVTNSLVAPTVGIVSYVIVDHDGRFRNLYVAEFIEGEALEWQPVNGKSVLLNRVGQPTGDVTNYGPELFEFAARRANGAVFLKYLAEP